MRQHKLAPDVISFLVSIVLSAIYSHTSTEPSTPLVNACCFVGWYETQVTMRPLWAGASATLAPLTRFHVITRPSSLPLTTNLSASPRHDRIRYSLFLWPLYDCKRPPFALSKRRIVESKVDTRMQLLSDDCQTLVIGSVEQLLNAKRGHTSHDICNQLSKSQIVCTESAIDRTSYDLVVFYLQRGNAVFRVFKNLYWHTILWPAILAMFQGKGGSYLQSHIRTEES